MKKIEDFDILVVNDGSKDDTHKKLSQFGNLITVISSKQNFDFRKYLIALYIFLKKKIMIN